jgi:hypothetical protein
MIVAVEPLELSAMKIGMEFVDTYIAPRARMRATEIFVRGFMFKFHTRKIGRMPNVQSVTALSVP